MKKNKKVVGYTRISLLKEKSSSISTQRSKIKSYCELNNLDLVGTYEEVVSGKSTENRIEYLKVMELVENGQIDGVVVYQISRWGRGSVGDMWKSIETLKKYKCEFYSVQEKIDTDSPQGRFFLNILFSMYQMEREMISKRTSDTLQNKKSNFEVYGNIPFGYNRDGNKLVENPNEMILRKKILMLHNKGYSFRKISRWLNEKGYKSKKGKQFYHQTIKYIINNPLPSVV